MQMYTKKKFPVTHFVKTLIKHTQIKKKKRKENKQTELNIEPEIIENQQKTTHYSNI